ncbi:hypothetical protein FS842_004649, partial [Serendipita sp. 407]
QWHRIGLPFLYKHILFQDTDQINAFINLFDSLPEYIQSQQMTWIKAVKLLPHLAISTDLEKLKVYWHSAQHIFALIPRGQLETFTLEFVGPLFRITYSKEK